jgi:nucleoside-diphosphate-sugar epimerase
VTTLSRAPAKILGTYAHLTVDIGDREEIRRAIRELEPNAILHAASLGVIEKVELLEMLRINAVGTDNLLAAAKSLKARPPVVIAGSGYEYAPQSRPLTEYDPIRPASPYGISKAAATFCAASYSAEIPITVLRIFNVYGPGERVPRLLPYIVENAKSGKPIELTSCEQVRDFVYVRDIASLFWRALECPPVDGQLRILNAGSGMAVRLKEFVCTVIRVLARQGINAQAEFGSRPYKSGEPMYYVAANSRLEEALGSFPFTTPEAGIRQSLESM